MNTDIVITKVNNVLHGYLLLAQNMELSSPIFGRKIVEIYLEGNKLEGIMQNAATCQSLLNCTSCFRVGERCLLL